MACSYCHSNDKSIFDDIESMIEDEPPSLLKSQSRRSDNQSIKSVYSIADVIHLERGGCVIVTKLGTIQYGIPPETIKDSLNKGLEVPTYYIIPTKRFDKKLGMSTAEFEFPAYFNFFCKKRQITLICSKDAEYAIRAVFQETLLGPLDHSEMYLDFYHKYPKSAYPDFHKERSIFSRNPSNLEERLTIDHLLKFEIFDKENQVTLTDGQTTVKIVYDESGSFKIIENGTYLKSIKDQFLFPDEYNEYIVTKPDDYRVESQKNIRQPSTPTMTQINKLPEISAEEKFNQFSRHDKRKPSVLMWNDQGGKLENGSIVFEQDLDEGITFTPPDFGVTILGCSHGFDPKGTTSGYIFWIHGRGIMVDPPPFASYHLKQMGIPSILICAVIISHCHADHDAGTFHKILDDRRVEIITTRTIMNSFLRKYSAMSGIDQEQLKKLFIFRPAIIGTPQNIYGAIFEFFYSIHSIPCVGFSVRVDKKSIFFSADTFYDPEKLLEYKNQGLMTQRRYEELAFVNLNHDIILHEAGVPPMHTSQTVLGKFDNNLKNRLYLVHVAQKDLKKELGLKIAKQGIENTMILIPSNTNKHITTLRRLDLLSSIDIFEHLTIKNIRWLLDSLISEDFQPSDILIKEGSIGDRFYIIESGLAKVFCTQKGSEFERYYQVGDYFGESAVLQNDGRRGARYFSFHNNFYQSVQAVTHLKVLILEKHDFWFIFGDGLGGQGPIIQKMKSLAAARKSKAVHCIFKNQLFSELQPSQKTQLEMILKEQDIEKGTVMWKVGEKPEFAFLIKKGTFEFIDCPEQDLEELDSGAYIGEAKAMVDGTPHTTSIRATRKSVIFKISKKDLLNFLNKHPGLFVIITDFKYVE